MGEMAEAKWSRHFPVFELNCKNIGIKPIPKDEWEVPRLDGDTISKPIKMDLKLGKATAAVSRNLESLLGTPTIPYSKRSTPRFSVNADMEILYDRPKEDSKRTEWLGHLRLNRFLPIA
jgi:hypothetical protein